MGQDQSRESIDALCAVPDQMERVLEHSEWARDIARAFCDPVPNTPPRK
jgi:hypothetical protein